MVEIVGGTVVLAVSVGLFLAERSAKRDLRAHLEVATPVVAEIERKLTAYQGEYATKVHYLEVTCDRFAAKVQVPGSVHDSVVEGDTIELFESPGGRYLFHPAYPESTRSNRNGLMAVLALFGGVLLVARGL